MCRLALYVLEATTTPLFEKNIFCIHRRIVVSKNRKNAHKNATNFLSQSGPGQQHHADDTSNRYRIKTALSARACSKMSNKSLLLLDLIAFNRASETSISISAASIVLETHRVIHHHQ